LVGSSAHAQLRSLRESDLHLRLVLLPLLVGFHLRQRGQLHLRPDLQLETGHPHSPRYNRPRAWAHRATSRSKGPSAPARRPSPPGSRQGLRRASWKRSPPTHFSPSFTRIVRVTHCKHSCFSFSPATSNSSPTSPRATCSPPPAWWPTICSKGM